MHQCSSTSHSCLSPLLLRLLPTQELQMSKSFSWLHSTYEWFLLPPLLLNRVAGRSIKTFRIVSQFVFLSIWPKGQQKKGKSSRRTHMSSLSTSPSLASAQSPKIISEHFYSDLDRFLHTAAHTSRPMPTIKSDFLFCSHQPQHTHLRNCCATKINTVVMLWNSNIFFFLLCAPFLLFIIILASSSSISSEQALGRCHCHVTT